jgi:hypothetical protein
MELTGVTNKGKKLIVMVNKEIKKIFFFTLPTGLSPVLLQ